MRTFYTLLSAAVLAGCAMTYKAPTGPDQSVSVPHGLHKSDAFSKATRALLMQGFQIQSSDEESGYISSSMKNWRLTPRQADCGTTMGLDYLRDNRTKTEVAFNIVIDETTLNIRSNIHGEYKPGAVDQDITLTCISLGVIEKNLADQIIW